MDLQNRRFHTKRFVDFPFIVLLQIFIRTFPDAIKEAVLWPVIKFWKVTKTGPFKASPRNLLQSFDGCLKPGELCLVLGRPGSGCTTFLKTIANQRGGYLGVKGDVNYGGISAEEMRKRYRGEVAYNQEDDVHHATLTVAQTLMFALRLKTPGNLLPGHSRKTFQKEVLDVLVNMLGIPHTKNTKVGSAYVRGVSGGERKRVSIAEMVRLFSLPAFRITISDRSSHSYRWRLVPSSNRGTTQPVDLMPRPPSTTRNRSESWPIFSKAPSSRRSTKPEKESMKSQTRSSSLTRVDKSTLVPRKRPEPTWSVSVGRTSRHSEKLTRLP